MVRALLEELLEASKTWDAVYSTEDRIKMFAKETRNIDLSDGEG